MSDSERAKNREMSGVISITTDFGSRDWYAGAVKGVILSINPRARIVDLTHGIGQGDITGAALALRSSYHYFPRGTIHLVVVDPGVGGGRRVLVTEHDGYFFVAPDNGILSLALGKAPLERAYSVEKREYLLRNVSATFHGRDVFAPVAAYLSLGVAVEYFGPACGDCVRGRLPSPRRLACGEIEAEVIYRDVFGNLVTNIDKETSLPGAGRNISIRLGERGIAGISETYSSVPEGALLALWGSSGYLEISVNGGSAAEATGAKRGDRITLAAPRRKTNK